MLRRSCAAGSENDRHLSSPQTDVSVVTLFCTQEHGLLLQDCLPKPSGLQALLAVDVPHYYFSCKVRREHCPSCALSTVYCGVAGKRGRGCFRLQKPNLDVYLQYITLLIHNSVWSYVCVPAIILEGGVLSTRSKCLLQYSEQALVFLIHVCCNCALRKCQ